MQVLVTTSAVVICNECGNEQVIDADLFDDDPSSYDHGDNAMGEEIDHLFIAEVDCDNCGNNLRVEARCSEYPVGAFNFDTEYKSIGCKILEQPSVDPDYRDDIDDMEFYDPDYYGSQSIRVVFNEIEGYQKNPDILKHITPRQFEEAVCKILEAHGFEIVELTPATRDGGKDIIAKYVGGGIPFLIYVECKQWDPSRKLGVSVVRNLSAVQRDRNINKSIIITTSSFTSGAIKYADEQEMSLLDWEHFKKWLADAVVSKP